MIRKDDKDDNMWVQLGIYGTVGFQLAIAVVGGLWIGYLLDQKFGTLPWLSIIGLGIGAVGGFYNLFRILNGYQSKK